MAFWFNDMLYFGKINPMGYTMKINAVLWIALLLFLSGCGSSGQKNAASPTPPPASTQQALILPTVTPACVGEEPTQQDIDRALEFTGDLFAGADWERSYLVMKNRIGVTWMNNSIGAVAYLEALIFPCGYEDQDVDAYFTDETWAVVFENYDRYEILSACRTGNGLRLYEIKADSMGFDYDIRYWAGNDTNNRVLTMMMTFPAGSDPVLGEYATRLFPPLTDCK
jgi:hypothetical protein